MKKLTIYFSIVLCFVSCSHHKEIGKDHLVKGSCEEKFKDIELGEGQLIWQNVTEGTGTGISYLITGLGYSTDVAISFTSGVIAGITACSPLLAIDVLASKYGNHTHPISGECIGKVGVATGKALNPNLGPKAFEGTQKWRCPDLDKIVSGLTSVADCYSKKGEPELARTQIQEMIDSEVFKTCLSSKALRTLKDKKKSY